MGVVLAGFSEEKTPNEFAQEIAAGSDFLGLQTDEHST
jgi:hypothetical protein